MDQPASHFLIFFWGGEGSTFLVDALSNFDEIYVPDLEPLEHHKPHMQGVTVARKLEWLRVLYDMPRAADHGTWHRSLQDVIPALAEHLAPCKASARLCGLKVRPSVFIPSSHTGTGRMNLGRLLRFVRSRVPVPSRLTRAVVASPRLTGFGSLLTLLRDADVRVIFLRRENVLRQALSIYRMMRQARSQFSSRRGPTTIDPTLLQRHITDYENSLPIRDALMDQMDRRGITFTERCYESLNEDPVAELEQLLGFVGLVVDRPTIDRVLTDKVRFSKTSATLRDLVTNYHELEAHFAGSHYERFLDS